MGVVSKAPAPLYQGDQNTCTCYAFGQCVTSALLSIYETHIEAKDFVEKVKTLMPSWEGRDIGTVCEEWNDVRQKEGAWVENVDRSKRFQISVRELELVDDFATAYAVLEAVRGCLMMLCSIKTGSANSQDPNHAVAAFATYEDAGEKKLIAVNSWPSEPIIHVTAENFNLAVLIVPVIEACKSGDRKVSKPPTNALFAHTMQGIATVRVQPLVTMIRDGSATEKEAAAALLRHGLRFFPEYRQAMVAAGGIEPLVTMIRDGSAAEKEAALLVLHRLGYYVDASKEAIVAAGSIEPLVTLARGGSNIKGCSPIVRFYATVCLRMLASKAANKEAIAAAGCSLTGPVRLSVSTTPTGDDQPVHVHFEVQCLPFYFP